MIAAALLGMGFALVTTIESAELAALPLLPDWCATLHPTAHHLLEIHEPGGMLYDGDLGHAPPGSSQTVQRSGRLVVLVSSTLALDMGDRYGQLTVASRAGEIVGAQLPLS